MSILFAIALFSLLIFLHELGHFVAAKLSGVRVNEFSMFMGPAIWKKQKGETLYSIRCIPIGGYCAMEGEDGGSDDPRSFDRAAWWKRFIILAAGSFMNFLTGLVLLGIFYGPDQQFILPVVTQIEDGCTIVGEYGIQEGDRILELDGEKIYVYSDFQMILELNGGEQHDLVLLRDGRRVELKDFAMVKREFPNEDGSTSLRFGFSFSLVPATFTETVKYVWNSALDMVRMVRLSLKMLLSGQAGIQDVGGPVMIVQQMTQVAEASSTTYYAVMNLIYFGAFIAINLAVMNLLPIPALDGGRIVCLLITTVVEAVTRKKIDPKYEGYLHGAGMILLLALMAVIMFKDIFVLIKG
ncbi:MAG: M50 family metallopeptidase [Candidatus Faecousia sp.]|nr:site-2 protease family protein [Clostridiales bacterium]MDY6180435.1 M50 family metallopeptidase [Candidatus Faecousia sp.]